jgi:hypothetical protein
MGLEVLWLQFKAETDLISGHARDFAAKRTRAAATDFSFGDECLLEGLLSRLWQSWNTFCRSCAIESCIGTADALGNKIAGLPGAASEADVSGAAILAKKSATGPYWSSPNHQLRSEPTWGDVDVLSTLLTRLNPTNHSKMLAAFSSHSQSAKTLQTIRNGAAHNHHQNFSEIQKLRSAYVVFPITHPTHAMFWIEPKSKDFLVTHLIDDLKVAGYSAVTKNLSRN